MPLCSKARSYYLFAYQRAIDDDDEAEPEDRLERKSEGRSKAMAERGAKSYAKGSCA